MNDPHRQMSLVKGRRDEKQNYNKWFCLMAQKLRNSRSMVKGR